MNEKKLNKVSGFFLKYFEKKFSLLKPYLLVGKCVFPVDMISSGSDMAVSQNYDLRITTRWRNDTISFPLSYKDTWLVGLCCFNVFMSPCFRDRMAVFSRRVYTFGSFKLEINILGHERLNRFRQRHFKFLIMLKAEKTKEITIKWLCYFILFYMQGYNGNRGRKKFLHLWK